MGRNGQIDHLSVHPKSAQLFHMRGEELKESALKI
jgi:hypothetical protein